MSFSLPKLFKYLSLAAFLGVVVYLAIQLSSRNNPLRPRKPTDLSVQLVGVSNDFRYVHRDQNVDRLILTAAKDTAFTNGQHQLEEVKLETFGQDGKPLGVLTSKTADYDSQTQVAVFKKDVLVVTTDELVVRTNEMKYDQAANVTSTEAPVTFTRRNITGTCVGAKLDSTAGRFVMNQQVKITIAPESTVPASPVPSTTASATSPPQSAPDQDKKNKKDKKGKKDKKDKKDKKANRVKENGNQLSAASKPASTSPVITAEIPTTITGDHAEYWKPEKQVYLTGNAIILQGGNELRADKMTAFLDDNQRIQKLETRARSFLKSAEKQGQVESQDMDILFTSDGDVQSALATGNPVVKSFEGPTPREVTGDRIEVSFAKVNEINALQQFISTGNARLVLAAPPVSPQDPQPAQKTLTANQIEMRMYPDGRFAESATAKGNAVLTILPSVTTPQADQKQLQAPEMKAQFFETGNLMRTFMAEGGVQLAITPLEPNTKRLKRSSQSDRATVQFDQMASDITSVEQEGNFQFEEGKKQARAQNATYLKSREMVYLRGNRPAVWDDLARTEAQEIDLSNLNPEHEARGNVRTTYYSQESTGQSTPFGKTKSPVFLTAQQARVNTQNGKAIYQGEARAWQDDNFIRGDIIELFQTEKRMTATGHVSSALYQMERTNPKGQKQAVPIFGSSEFFSYNDSKRQARYERNSRLIQGEDTLSADSTDIYLAATTNQVEHLIAQGKVVLTQPQRRGTGDQAEYTASDDKFVLVGNMARVEDSAQGTTTGPRLTFLRSDGSVLATDQRQTQRIRTTHKISK